MELKNCPHLEEAVKITVVKDYKKTTVQAHTERSRYEQGVGSRAAVFIGKEIVAQIKLKLDSRCSNNQAEQLAIIKALETVGSIHSLLRISNYTKQPYLPTAKSLYRTPTTTPTLSQKSERW